VPAPADLLTFLRDVRLFTRFQEPDLIALAESLRERRLRRNQVLFREGDPGDELFIVRHGSVLVSKAIKGRVEQVLDHVRPADFFGEMSLLDGSPRSATVQAEADATLLVLNRSGLQGLTDTNPHAAAAFFSAMVHVFIERLRRSTHQVAEATRWGLEATGLDVGSR
jgi:CRP/FNR family transcriptional regulator, cyclic AMP receptor protein